LLEASPITPKKIVASLGVKAVLLMCIPSVVPTSIFTGAPFPKVMDCKDLDGAA
jgi:hypothetical protein